MNYGRYEIIKEVGRGSMGVVFQARDPQIDRLVAVKVLRADRVESENFVQRFLKEAKVIGRLSHPHIVVIYDVGEEHGSVYIAMEFLDGRSLSERYRDRSPDVKEVVSLGIQLAETLNYAHQKGVVHRDVKPSNIIVQSDGQVKITDFGIAHVDDTTATLTQIGEIMGTPAYMSPEQVKGEPVDGRSDIFSLGIILYELATRRRPFGGDTKSLATVLNDIVEVTPKEPASLVASVPKEFSRVVMKALQKDPEKRFQTGKDFAEALGRCLDHSKPGQEAGSRRGLYAAAAGGAAIALAAIGFFTFSSAEKAGHRSTAAVKPSVPAQAPGGAASAPRIPEAARPAPSASPLPPSSTTVTPVSPVRKGSTVTPVSPLPPATVRAASPSLPPAPVREARPAAPPHASRPPVAQQQKTLKHDQREAKEATRKKKSTASSAASQGKEQKAERTVVKDRVVEGRPAAHAPSPEPPKEVMGYPREASAPAPKPVARFAFLRVATSPPGAKVFVNGAHKGTTPMSLKLDLGQYQIRLSRPGYQEVQKDISLERMKEYPLVESLKPIE